ncbi:MAG: HDIG domain-containing protein [Clostridiales bacterium]|nr:HDIG domain-containing protein [Clostridiales bacterium]
MKENKKRLILIIASLWVATVLGITVCATINRATTKVIFKFGLLAIIFNAIFTYYLEIFQTKILNEKFAWWLVGAGYFCSIVLLCNPYEIGKYSFWLFGLVLIAIYVDTNLSLIMTYSILFMSLGLSLLQFDEIIIPLVLGTFLCLMGKFLTSLRNLFYLTTLILSMNVSLLLIMNGFNLNRVENKQNMLMLSSNLLMLLVLFFITRIFKVSKVEEMNILVEEKVEGEAVSNFEAVNDDQESGNDELKGNEELKASVERNAKEELDQKLIAAVAEDAPLLQLLAQESYKLYQHSKLVGTIAKNAAKAIGVDENLTCAGGWYHEIGRLRGKDYIVNGVALVEEYHLPKEIEPLIRQHNYNVEVPKSMEAVIVMLTDNIVSTITYLKNNPETKIAKDKIVENTFSVLMNKGTFNEARIDIGRFIELKEFYRSMINELM